MKTTLFALLTSATLLFLSACQDDRQTGKTTENPTQNTAKESTPAPKAKTAEDQPASTASVSPHPGEALHSEHCARCHDPDFYTRPDRKVNSKEKLTSMVRMCDSNLGTGLFDEDMDNIADFLDTSYYKFPK